MSTTTPANNLSGAEIVNATSDATDAMTNITEAVPTLTEMNDAEILRLVPTLVYLGIISVTGILGNGLVCHIYRTRYRLSNSQIFILCLSAIDLFSCCVVIPFEVSTVINQYTFKYAWLCKFSRFFNTLSTLSSSFLLLFIAIDRYRKVCKPFSRQISAKVAKFLCLLAVILGLVFSWPAVLVYGKKTFSIPDYGMVGTECSTDDSMENTMYPFINVSVYGVLFVSGIISIIILYCLIGREVQNHVNRMPKEYSRMRNSVPMLSSSMADRGSKIDGEIDINAITRYEKAKSKNKEQSKRVQRKSKKPRSASDVSWSEGGQQFEMQERKAEDIPGNEVDKKSFPANSEDGGGITNETFCVDDQHNGLQPNDPDNFTDINKTNAENVETNNTTYDTNPDIEKNIVIQNSNSISPVSSQGSLGKKRKSVVERLQSITSQMSSILSRMTSITSRQSEPNTSTVGKTQYLKQARARKTAFLMFLISLAFVLSYLPHLLLMLIRALKDDFVDNMTDTERAVYKFFLRSYFLNCAINPIIYAACASRFRTECKELFSRLCGRADSEDIKT